MGIALDYTERIAPSALEAADATYVSRYLSWLPNPKVIGKAEYDELTAAGITVLLNWEFDAHDWLSGTSGGAAHGAEAVRQARALGYPTGRPIIGSADFNMSLTQWNAASKAYATAFAAQVSAAGFTPGVYGPWDVLGWCQGLGVFGVFWQAGMSTSWSSNRNAQLWPGAQLRQRAQVTVGGIQADRSDIIKEVADVPLTQADADLIWNTKIGGPGDNREAHYALSDLRDMLIDGKSSYTGQTYGAVANLSAKVDKVLAALAGGLTIAVTDAQVTAAADRIAAALVASNANGLTAADHAGVVADVEKALRDVVNATPAA